MSKALLIIDYSNDFIDDKGALTYGEVGQVLDESICDAIKDMILEDGFIFACNDRHQINDPYDMEAKLFPAHNIVGTWGEELYGKTGDLVRELLKIQPEKTVYVPKLCYSAFQGTPLDAMLRVRAVDTLVVCGVCTDICVLHTVIAARYLGYRVQVMLNACATMNEIGQKWAFAHIRDCLSVELI